MAKLKLPSDFHGPVAPVFTRQAIKAFGWDKVDNLALCINRLPEYAQYSGQKEPSWHLPADDILGVDMKEFYKKIMPAIAKRQAEIVSFSGLQTLSLSLVPSDRWVLGLGNESVYENGLTLHHVYGCPYLPGSSIKGITRTWVVQNCFENEAQAVKDATFQDIFGYATDSDDIGKKGLITFFDAFSSEFITLSQDIMNVHYQDYYEGKSSPGDWLSPNPIMFLSAKGGLFKVAVGCREQYIQAGKDKIMVEKTALGSFPNLLDCAVHWIEAAFRDHGIGAKTAIGYGRMNGLDKPK
jgi:CRISPR-associated protein Cmr6